MKIHIVAALIAMALIATTSSVVAITHRIGDDYLNVGILCLGIASTLAAIVGAGLRKEVHDARRR